MPKLLSTSLFLLLFIAYFTYHLFSGNNGLLAKDEWIEKNSLNQQHINALNAQYTNILNNIALLKGDDIDQDMLDEQLRRTTGFAKPDEVIIYK